MRILIKPTYLKSARERMPSWRRLAITAVGAMTLAIGAFAPAVAGAAQYETVVVVERPSVWTIAAGQCSTIPAGLSVDGTGHFRLVVQEKQNSDGTIDRVEREHAEGIATDSQGNRYSWKYDNVARIQNSLANPDVFVGPISDKFRLTGRGPAHLTASFRGIYTEEPTTFSIYATEVHGDPIALPVVGGVVAAHCDPV